MGVGPGQPADVQHAGHAGVPGCGRGPAGRGRTARRRAAIGAADGATGRCATLRCADPPERRRRRRTGACRDHFDAQPGADLGSIIGPGNRNGGCPDQEGGQYRPDKDERSGLCAGRPNNAHRDPTSAAFFASSVSACASHSAAYCSSRFLRQRSRNHTPAPATMATTGARAWRSRRHHARITEGAGSGASPEIPPCTSILAMA